MSAAWAETAPAAMKPASARRVENVLSTVNSLNAAELQVSARFVRALCCSRVGVLFQLCDRARRWRRAERRNRAVALFPGGAAVIWVQYRTRRGLAGGGRGSG